MTSGPGAGSQEPGSFGSARGSGSRPLPQLRASAESCASPCQGTCKPWRPGPFSHIITSKKKKIQTQTNPGRFIGCCSPNEASGWGIGERGWHRPLPLPAPAPASCSDAGGLVVFFLEGDPNTHQLRGPPGPFLHSLCCGFRHGGEQEAGFRAVPRCPHLCDAANDSENLTVCKPPTAARLLGVRVCTPHQAGCCARTLQRSCLGLGPARCSRVLPWDLGASCAPLGCGHPAGGEPGWGHPRG